MRKSIFIAIAALILMGCKPDTKDSFNPYEYITDTSHLIIRITDSERLQTAISNNPLLASLIPTELAEQFDLLPNQNLTPQSGIVVMDNNDNDSIVLLTDSTTLKTQRNIENGKRFKRLFDSSSPSATASILLSPEIANRFTTALFDTPAAIFEEFTLLDIFVSGNGFRWEMVGLKSESKRFLSQGPKYASLLSSYVSDKADSFQNFLIDEISGQQSSLLPVNYDDESYKALNDFMKGMEQWGLMNIDGTQLGLFKTINSEQSLAQINNTEGPVGQFRNVTVFELDDFVKNAIFSVLVPENSWELFCVIEDVFVLGNSTKDLETVIAALQNGKTLSSKIENNEIFQSLGSTSEVFSYKKNSAIKVFLNKLKLTAISSDQSYGSHELAAQLTSDNAFYFLDGVLTQSSTVNKPLGLTERFSLRFDDNLAIEPQLIYNHRTKSYSLLVQDSKFKLKLISSEGAVQWQKPLDGLILGHVEQLDMFKNGRQQLVFATSKTIHVIDINGNDVPPFPLKLKDPITQPLTVFDYDQKRDYRLSVVQGADLFLLGMNAKRVAGFKYKSNKELIRSQPTHYRIAGKDYIVFRTGEDGLKILNRLGEDRIRIKSKTPFSDHPISVYNNLFSGLSQQGELIQIDLNGAVVKVPLDTDSNHGFAAEGKSLVTINDNILTINGTRIELPFGNYTSPEIWRNFNSMIIGLADLQSSQIFIFDSEGRVLPGFPVFGKPNFDLKITGKGQFQLSTLGDGNSIIFYDYR